MSTPGGFHHEVLLIDLEAARYGPAGRQRPLLQAVVGARRDLEPGLAAGGGRREQEQAADEHSGADDHGPSSPAVRAAGQNPMVLPTAIAPGRTATFSFGSSRHSQRPAASPSVAKPAHIAFSLLNDVCLHSISRSCYAAVLAAA